MNAGQHATSVTDVIKEDGAWPLRSPRVPPGVGVRVLVLHRADLRGEDGLPDPGQPLAPAPGVLLACTEVSGQG